MTIVHRSGPTPFRPPHKEENNTSRTLKVGPGVGGATAAPAASVQTQPVQQDPRSINFDPIDLAYLSFKVANENSKDDAWDQLVEAIEREMFPRSTDTRTVEEKGDQIIAHSGGDPIKEDILRTAVGDVYIDLTTKILSPPQVTVDRRGRIIQTRVANTALSCAASWIPHWAKKDPQKEFHALYSLLENLYDSGIARPILAEVVARYGILGDYTVPLAERDLLDKIKQFIGKENPAASWIVFSKYETVHA